VSSADEARAAKAAQPDAALAAPATDSTPDTVDGVAFARLYGEPLFRLPTDLYIPPDALEVFLETFEGPLDLLLYLIRKQNFNVSTSRWRRSRASTWATSTRSASQPGTRASIC
jgi:segregation and condensation protein A